MSDPTPKRVTGVLKIHAVYLELECGHRVRKEIVGWELAPQSVRCMICDPVTMAEAYSQLFPKALERKR